MIYFHSKKAVSLLIFALVGFFVLTVLAVSTWQAVEKISLNDVYAGIDAQILSDLRYKTDKEQFFLDNILHSFLKEDFSYSNFYEYLRVKRVLPSNNFGLVLENGSRQYFSVLEREIVPYLEFEFQEFYNQKASLFFQFVGLPNNRELNLVQHPLRVSNPLFHMYVETNHISVISTHTNIFFPQTETSFHVIYPSSTIQSTKVDELSKFFLAPIAIKVDFMACIRDTDESSPYSSCREETVTTYSSLFPDMSLSVSSIFYDDDSTEDILLYLTLEEGVHFSYFFRKP